jgi:rubredoxin
MESAMSDEEQVETDGAESEESPEAPDTYSPYFQALLWTCKTCGFVKEGEQPHMECPICESYKANFIDIPQHIEREIRETYPGKNPNARACRERRLELMQQEDADSKKSFSGRMLPSQSGNNMQPS